MQSDRASTRERVRLGDVCQIYDGPHATPTKTTEGPVFLSISSLDNGRLDLSQSACLSEEDYLKWTRRVTPREDDVLFSYETRLGEAAILSGGLRCCLGRRMGLLRVKTQALLPRFLLYSYLGPQFQRVIAERQVSGSTVPRILLTEMRDFPLEIPPIDEQRRVVRVLGALDDKIESNRRLASILEEAVATLFRGRFVDFVGATDLVESELGGIPRGWRVAPLEDLVANVRERPASDELAYIGLDDMPRGSTVLYQWKTDDSPAGASSLFRAGDVLFGKLRPYFRKVGVATIDGRCSTEILVLRPRRTEWFGIALGHLSSERFIAHCVAVSTGTRMPRAEWSVAGKYRIAVPPEAEAQSFAEFMRDVYAQIAGLVHESRTLTELRDTLLPKLVSGEIRVRDAEEVVEAA
jgi:type I restriction enzyme S subunit